MKKNNAWKRHFLRGQPSPSRRTLRPLPARAHRYQVEALEPRLMLDGDLTQAIGGTIAGGMGNWSTFLEQLESSTVFDYTVPLLINVDNPASPRPPTLNDMLSHYVDVNNDGNFVPLGEEGILIGIDGSYGKTDNYVTWDEVFQKKIGDRISSYLNNSENFSGTDAENAATFATWLNVNLDDNTNPVDGIPDNAPIPGFSVSASANYRHQDVTLSGSTMTPGQIAWSLDVLISRTQDYGIDLGRNAELFGLTIDDNDAIRATATMRIGFTFGVETRKDVVTDTKGTADTADDTYSLGSTLTVGGFFVDTSTPHGLFIPGLAISTDFEFTPNTPYSSGELSGQFGFLDVSFKSSKLEFDATIRTNLVDPSTTSAVTKPGRLSTGNLDAGVAALAPSSSIVRTGSLTGELNVYVDSIDDGLPGPNPSLFSPDPGAGAYATLLVTAPGDDIFAPAMAPDGSSDARPAPEIKPKAGDELKIEELTQFNNIGSQTIIGFLNQLSGALQSIQSSPLFNTEIPFSDGTTLGSILNLQETLQKKLLIDGATAKLINKDGVVQFTSAQGLANKLASLLGRPVSDIQATYDTATDELTYKILFELGFPLVDKAIDFDLDVGNIAGVTTNAVLKVGATNTLSFTFGANLKSLAPVTLNPSSRDHSIVALLKSDGTAFTPTSGVLTKNANFTLSFGSQGSVDVVLPAGSYTNPEGIRAALQTAINAKTGPALLPTIAVTLANGRLELQATTGASIRLRPLGAADGAVTELGFAWNDALGQTSTVVPVPANGVLPSDAVFSLRANGTTKVVTLTGASTQNGNTTLAHLASDLQSAIDAQFGAGKITVKTAGSVLALTSTDYSILQILSPNAVTVHDLGFTDQLVASKVFIPGVRELELTAGTSKDTSEFNGVLTGDASFNVSINGGTPLAVNVNRVPTIDVTGLGFTESQTSAGTANPSTLTAANEGPGAGRVAGNITFKISLSGGAATNVTLLRSSTTDAANLNYSVSDLAADLQAAINAAGAPLAGLTTSVSNNRLVLSKANATSIKVESVSVANASSTLDNGVTPAASGLDRLIADLNAGLAATAYQGGTLADWLSFAKQPDLTTTAAGKDDDFFLTLSARPGRPIDTLAITGGNSAFQETGFAASFSGTVSGPQTNGRVTSTATFLIAVNGNASVPITVTAAETSAFTSVGQLATLIQTKINATSLNGKILVTVGENRLLFSGLDQTLRLVRVTPERTGDGALTAAGTAAEKQLGIRETLVKVPESGAKFFVQDLGLDSVIEASATGIDARAYLGFVGIETSGGKVDIEGALSVDLKRDSDNSTRFTIGDLLTAISTGKVDEITTSPTLTWNGSALLDNIKLDTALPALTDLTNAIVGSPKLAFKFDSTGHEVIVDTANSNLSALAEFSALKFDSVLGGLKAIVTFLQKLEDIAAFDTKIPVLNLSFNDLVGAAARFQKVVAEFEANPTLAVQNLQGRLREALGLPSNSSLVSLGFDSANKILGLKFTVREGFDKGVGIDLDLNDLAEKAGVTIPEGLLNLRGSARLDTAGAVEIVFNFGIDLNALTANPGSPLNAMFLVVGNGADATQAMGTFTATGRDMSFTGGIGPVALHINDGSVTIDKDGDAATTDPLRLGVALGDADGGNDNRLYLSNFAASLGAAFTPVFEGGIGARLPVFFPTETFYLGDISVGVGNLAELFDGTGDGDDGDITLSLPDLSAFASGNFSLLDNLRMIVEGVDIVLDGLQSVLSGEIFGFSLPLVGDKLGDAAVFIQDLRTNIINKVRDALNQAPEQAVQVVTDALTAALGAGGLNVLKAPITTTGDPAAATGSFIQWNVPLGSNLVAVDVPIGFDLGLPGLGLEADGDLEIMLGWAFDFAFGLDLENGFYLDVSDITPTGAAAGFDPGKMQLNFDISLPDASLAGKLAFLKLVLQDDTDDDGENHTTNFSLDFTVDLVRSGGGNKLGLFEPQNLDIEWDVEGSALVDLDLTLTLNNNDLGVPNGVFPGLVADFIAGWSFNKDNIGDGGELTALSFEHIGLDLGSFISDFLGPIVKEVQKVTEPFQPLIEVITTPIPVLSDLAGKPITLIDLADMFGTLDAGFIYAIADIITLVNSLPTDASNVIITFFDSIDLLGDSNFSLSSLKDPTALNAKRNASTATSFIDSLPSLKTAKQAFGSFADKLNSSTASPGTKSFTQKLTTGGLGSGFSFPLLDDPTQLLGLLFGFNSDLVLFEYDMAPLEFSFEYSQFFPVWGPLGASITGTVGLTIDFAFGFDTFGIRKFADGGYEYPLDIFRGFYVKDTADGTGTGTELPEITFLLQLVGAAEINLGIASGGVGGGLRSTTYFDLNDPDNDGRVRIEELLNNFLLGFTEDFPVGPLSIFDVSGKLEAFLTAYISFLFVDFETQIGPSIPILEYSLPLDRPPVLATELGNGVLRLNMGPYAADRLHRNTTDGAENFTVKHISGDPGNEKVEVTATFNGKTTTQTYSGVKRIIAEGGLENDVITMTNGVKSPMELSGGAGDDRIELLGSGPATILGGTGNDTLIGGSSADSIDGGAGNDSIQGGGENDTLRGGDDNDTILGEAGNDMIFGELGDDSVDGGAGADFIDGGAGKDILKGGTENDTITGGFGSDTLSGDAGNDSLAGGADSDLINGNEGNDTLWGDSSFTRNPTGDVTVTTPVAGSEGNDTLLGDAGNDSIWGERGNDSIRGGTGNDWADGGVGADTISGNEGNDTLLGAADGDQIFGNGGADSIDGGSGNDIIFGDDGEVKKDLTGGSENYDGDLLTIDRLKTIANPFTSGDPANFDGNDIIVGGAGDDTAFGGGGADKLFGDIDVAAITAAMNYTGNDLLVGDYAQVDYRYRRTTRVISLDTDKGGDDTLHGNNGNDTLIGGAAKDTLHGGQTPLVATTSPTDNDIIVGDSGELLYGELINPAAPTTSARLLTLARSVAPTQGDIDSIWGEQGDDVIIGGAAGDQIDGSTGQVVSLGDNGEIAYLGGKLLRIETSDTVSGTGGSDTIVGKNVNDILVGGVLGDAISGNAGDDILVGDNVRLDFLAGVVTTIATKDFSLGGNDTISGAAGKDTVIGGSFNDALSGSTGDDVLIGDNGTMTFVGGVISKIETTDTAANTTPTGKDTILGEEGDDTILGGADADSLFGAAGNDVILGDNGTLDYQLVEGQPGAKLKKIFTGAPGFGGSDTIEGNAGNDVIFGGALGDAIKGNDATDTLPGGGTDDDVVFGDGGELIYNGGALRELRSIDTNVGGVDTIQGNKGADTILGGAAGDLINGNEGNDIVLGDNGELLWVLSSPISVTAPDGWTGSVPLTTTPGALLVIRTYAPLHGGSDTIAGDAGDDTLMGGTNADTLSGDTGDTAETGTGNDMIFGDHGVLFPTLPSNRNFFSKDTGADAAGAGDRIHGNGGNDTVIAGQGDDTVLGGDGHDAIVGGHNIDGDTRIDLLSNTAPGVSVPQDAAGIVKGSSDTGDHIDGGRGFDVIAGDNAWIIRVVNGDTQSASYSTDLLFRALNSDGLLYDNPVDGLFAANLTATAQPEPGKPELLPARTVVLLDHTKTTATGRYGADLIAGGADNDTVFGQLGDDSLHGDGRLDAADAFALKNALAPETGGSKDGNDYVEGNGGSDTILGGRGQDNILGGSSDLFGLTTAAQRPDTFDLVYGGNNSETGMNDYGDATARAGSDVFLQDDENVAANGHSRDADVILGDNGRIFRIVAGGNFAAFNYDGQQVSTGGSGPANANTLGYNNPSGYGLEKIQVRAFELMDYSPGAGGVGGNFGSDRIFGESGDDTIHGMEGSDSLFGDGQDDDIYGGTGHDWIHGGTGEDGIVGDDGLIKTSRNGLAESLYGIAAIPAAQLNLFIKTPGSIQQSYINIVNQLHKTPDLEPFALETANNVPATGLNARPAVNSDDIIFGGLGSDSLHGGAGDDAISGAEALPVFYSLATTSALGGSTSNPGNLLRFGVEDPQEFLLYDEYNPLGKIVADFAINNVSYTHLLNFVARNGNTAVNDGRDKLFGDLGNDWLVGGTNRDNLYGGFGNDMLDTDDDKDTAGGANNAPDERSDFFYADIAYGGGGRDVLLANTGKDRIIDWVGEFNSYLVPFAPYGAWTISRTMQPQLPEYLYALSRSDGADQSRTTGQTHTVAFPGGDSARNGEPYGELGLVKQQDEFWKAQTGAPDDPQAGNIPGGPRDEWKSESFGSSAQTSFASESASWSVKQGTYQVTATDGKDATSIMFVEDSLPAYFELETTINTDKPRGGIKANGAIIFDYQSETNFKFAGIDVSTNKLVIGQRASWGWQVLSSVNVQMSGDKNYAVKLFVNGATATVQLNGAQTTAYTFANKLNQGLVGIGSDNATSRFDNVKLLVLPPNLTGEVKENFDDGVADFFNQTLGSWQITGGAYTGAPALGSNLAISTFGLAQIPGATTESSATFTIASGILSGFVFDYQSATDFKYAGYDAGAKKLVVGHRTSSGWFVDASYNVDLAIGSAQLITMSIENSLVNVSLNGVKQLSYKFNGFLDDGQLGLFSKGGPAKFDNVTGKSLQR